MFVCVSGSCGIEGEVDDIGTILPVRCCLFLLFPLPVESSSDCTVNNCFVFGPRAKLPSGISGEWGVADIDEPTIPEDVTLLVPKALRVRCVEEVSLVREVSVDEWRDPSL